MARIAGLVSDHDDRERDLLLGKMVAALSPDANWHAHDESSGKAAFGWRGCEKPQIAAVNGILAAMDGSIYNWDELGGGSGAELLARLIARYGIEKALGMLNGDFAVAAYDAARETLWLARDRFGVKPLYYVSQPGCIAFASRPRALLMAPGGSREVNRKFVSLFAASHYRTFDHDPTASPYASLAQLPAAHLLCWKNGRITKSPYWSLAQGEDLTMGEGELAARYRELLLDAVARRYKSARRPAFTLSGGMDSSSVLASAVHTAKAKQHAFSTVYEDATYDETPEIQSMLDAAVEEWHPVPVGSPDLLDLISRMIDLHDEPVATATWLSHYLLCREVSNQGFGSLFGGLGGDELNAGEYEYFFFFFADLQAAGCHEVLNREVEQWIAHHDHPIFRKSFDLMRDGLGRLVDLSQGGKCLVDRQRLGRYFSALNPDYFDLSGFEPPMEGPFKSYLKNRTYQDITRETLPCCLRAEDRQTVALGLDHFLPFLDHRLVELMFRVPGELKIRDGVTKHLLRQAMRGILPEATRTRIKKTGWNAPAHVWFAGPGRALLLDLVDSRAFRERGIYNVRQVRYLIDEHERIVSEARAEDNHMMFLWQLVNLELWFRWIENQ